MLKITSLKGKIKVCQTLQEMRHPYGMNPEIVNVSVEAPVHVPKVCVTDRTLNQEALVISYCAE